MFERRIELIACRRLRYTHRDVPFVRVLVFIKQATLNILLHIHRIL